MTQPGTEPRLPKSLANTLLIRQMAQYFTAKTRKQKWKEKQLYGYLKEQIGKIADEKTWI